jgi:peroxiredoxin
MDSLVVIGQVVPDFMLNDFDGKIHSPHSVRGKILVLVFWSAECPWSERADMLIESWRGDWGEQVEVWMIASNANESEELLQQVAKERHQGTVLLDSDHQIADQFGALTTPHCFVIDVDGSLRYRGALDDTTFRQRVATKYFLKDAVSAVLVGDPVDPADTPGFGCTIVRMNPSAS